MTDVTFDFSIPLVNQQTKEIFAVEESLDQFFSAEAVNGYCCAKCTVLKCKENLEQVLKEEIKTDLFDRLLKSVDDISSLCWSNV